MNKETEAQFSKVICLKSALLHGGKARAKTPRLSDAVGILMDGNLKLFPGGCLTHFKKNARTGGMC